jgi:aromatic ring-opening dioxygenase catalytic subunit (LigB family)
MAEIVAGIAVPHDPGYPARAKREGPEGEIAKLYGEVLHHLQAARPDVLVVFTNDHFNTFFFDNFPTFAIGVAESSSGPRDATDMPVLDVIVHERLAEHIRRQAIADGFDLSLTQKFGMDHGFMVPLSFLNPGMKIPVVPIWVNAFVKPLPNAARARALGQSVRAAIEAWPTSLRVAVMGAGSVSLEIGGPMVNPGMRRAIPGVDWVAHVQKRWAAAEIDQLVAEATEERMMAAGNVGGELLNFIAMLGVIGDHRPDFIEMQAEEGHIAAVWNLVRT